MRDDMDRYLALVVCAVITGLALLVVAHCHEQLRATEFPDVTVTMDIGGRISNNKEEL